MRKWLLIAALVFSSTCTAGCPWIVAVAVGVQHSARPMWRNDLSFYFGMLPKGTTFSAPEIDPVDTALLDGRIDGWQAAVYIEFLDGTGRVVGSRVVYGLEFDIPHSDIDWAFQKLVEAHRPQADSVTRVRTRTYNPRFPKLDEFTIAEVQLHLVMKAYLEEQGFTNAAMEAQLIYVDGNLEQGKKSFVIGPEIRWRNGDYSPGRRMRHSLNNP